MMVNYVNVAAVLEFPENGELEPCDATAAT